MRHSMNNTSTAGDAMSRRVIDEITFRTNLLALQTAVESAGNGAVRHSDCELPSLVERARPPAASVESLERPDPSVFE